MTLDPAIEQQLADMSDQDFAALTARVRPPTPRPGAAGRAAAAKRFGTATTNQKGTAQ